ncbi:MAG: ABC transporter permease [Gammaproteobacteria bacterium]|nr:ABC transporter permease [Gammaproteobacteria bacterium]
MAAGFMVQYRFSAESRSLSAWYWSIAVRYTRSGAGDRLVSFMSLVSISGLILGVAVLIIVLSVMNGFERELRERVLGVVPHAVVYREEGFGDWRAFSAELEQVPGVEATAPIAEGAGLIVAGDTVRGIVFYGIEPEAERNVSIIHRFLTAGSLDALEPGTFTLAIGRPLAESIGVGVGDTISASYYRMRSSLLAGPLPRTRRFTVGALFEVGADADSSQVLMHIDDAHRLLKTQGSRRHSSAPG